MIFSFCEKPNKVKFINYDSAKLINDKHWNVVNTNQNIYLSIDYLLAIESTVKDISFNYIQFYNEMNEPLAIAVTQTVKFFDKKSKYDEQLCKIGNGIKNRIINSIGIKVLVCGNVFSCGENGFSYTNQLSHQEAYNALNYALTTIAKSEKNKSQSSILLLKEYWPQNFDYSDNAKQNRFREFMIDVNMVLKIHQDWENIDDYLNSMTTKFRTKAKSVFKKSDSLVVKEFTAKDVLNHKERIEELYKNVVDKSDFSFGLLNGDSFVNLKQNLKDKYIIKGYFFEDKLIGFSSAITNGNCIDANYIGLDYDFNFKYGLYQKMLYDLVDLSICNKTVELRLGRTAEEIKSCLGAEPTNMKLYIKLKNSVSNKLIKPIIESISPNEFELRKPFKANFY